MNSPSHAAAHPSPNAGVAETAVAAALDRRVGGTLRYGASPFDFDRVVDFGTLGFGLTQQIVGPLLLSTGINMNVDPGSPYYGDVINSNIELRWQRRSYDVGVYFNPYEGIGGVRIRLNDFDFNGTGVPFVPYNPINPEDKRDALPL